MDGKNDTGQSKAWNLSEGTSQMAKVCMILNRRIPSFSIQKH